jgi:bifunctional UDP-N-acetylglucosamine pyrophosphorylase/glucosamine-1-phosphate N-acetyltransferase
MSTTARIAPNLAGMLGILLAAGRGTRMKNPKSKLLFEVNERPMVMTPFDALFEICEKLIVVVGYQGSEVKETILQHAAERFGSEAVMSKCLFYTQEVQGGTGHAVKTALDNLGKKISSYPETLVVNGDLPLMTQETLADFLLRSRQEFAQSSCLTFPLKVPTGMGRIVRDSLGGFEAIKEEKDASPDERRIQEVNGGVYFFQSPFLENEIKKLKDNNAQKELYLTDLLGKTRDSVRRTSALMAKRPRDLLGVNTTFELARVRRLAQQRLQKELAESFGVEFFDSTTAFVSARAKFEGHVVIGPSVKISGATRVGTGVVFEGCNFVKDSKIENGAKILWGSVLEDAQVGEASQVGPLARLRPGTVLGKKVKIGNFVETKKARFGDGAKASHLSYIGDAEIGSEANLGAGTITCNYDGFQKHPTKVGNRAFIGSDTQLIAPVTVGDDAYVASGTAVTQDVPAGAMAISRPDMVVKEGYARKIAEKRKNKG